MKTIRREQLSVLLTTLFLIPVVLIALALAYFGFCEARKAYWDHQVKLMCEKDGGATVFEKIYLENEDKKILLNAFGYLSIPNKEQKKGSPIFSITTDSYLHDRNPSVRRSEYQIIRSKDKKILAKQIIYSRVGGDFPTYAHHSSFSCIDMRMLNKNFNVEELTVIYKEKL